MKKLGVLLCFLIGKSLLAQENHLIILELDQPRTMIISGNEKPALIFVNNLRDTLSAVPGSKDTLTFYTRPGIVKIKRKLNNLVLHYYYAGIWRETTIYPIKKVNEPVQENFYRDSFGNVAWPKWSEANKLPLLYSPYRKYRSYLIPTENGDFFNLHGDRIRINKNKILYSLEGSTQITELTSFKAFEREEVYVTAHGDSLFGYLYRPVAQKAVPGCLLLQGGGTVGIENYLLEAEFLAAHGIATAIFNKSGEESSRGNTNFRFQSFSEKLDEYIVLFEWLRKLDGIDTKSIGVHGMSEGGRLSVDLAAKLYNQPAFVISVSGPFSSFADNQLYAINHYLHRSLWPNSVVASTVALWAKYYMEVTKDSISKQTQRDIDSLRKEHPNLYLPPPGNTPAADLRKEDINFSSISSLKQVEAPILFQLAEMDERVDIHRTARSVNQQRQNPNDWLRFYPETAHGMSDYWGNISSGYLYDKIEWLQSIKIIEK